MHLFDVDIRDKLTFQESKVFSAGNELTTFELDDICRVGLGICYDVRFPEVAQVYAKKGKIKVP